LCLHAAHVRPLHLRHLGPRLHLGHLRPRLHLGHLRPRLHLRPLHLRHLGAGLHLWPLHLLWHLGTRHRRRRPRHGSRWTCHGRCRPRHGRPGTASGSATTTLRSVPHHGSGKEHDNEDHHHASTGKHPAHSRQPFDETVLNNLDKNVAGSLAENL